MKLCFNNKIKIFLRSAGKVFRAVNKITNQQVAIKCIDFFYQDRKDLILSEIEVMRQMSAKNIVNYIECFVHTNKKEKELWIVMEYLDFGALTDIVIIICS